MEYSQHQFQHSGVESGFQDRTQPSPPLATEQPRRGTLSVVSFVLSFVAFGLPAVVIGVLALRQNFKHGYRGNGMAWAGIIIGAVHWVVAFAIFYIIWKLMITDLYDA